MAGYQQISFPRFALALAIVAAPALLLEQHEERWAWYYVALILLGLVIANWSGLSAFSGFVQNTLQGR
jgi:lipopolysaccharide export LptBFGC system permease protein LptF